MAIQILPSMSQASFINSLATFPLFVGGYGSGKTWAGTLRALILKLKCPNQNIGYYLPTYDLVNQIGYPRFVELLELYGLPYDLNKQNHVIKIRGAGSIIFRNMDNPDRIIGYEHAHAITDEIDTLKLEKAKACWNKIVARNRQKCPVKNTIASVTTPEGFNFTYERWGKTQSLKYRYYRASTYENLANLPDDYIENMRETYEPQLLDAYLRGLWVNLKSGRVYYNFDRMLNHSNRTLKPNEPVHIGMDFNVERMAAVIHVIERGFPIAVDEIHHAFDTRAIILIIKQRFHGHPITIYPDASSQNRHSANASETDLQMLRLAGFNVKHNYRNPFIQDRVNSMNSMFLNDFGDRRYLVNTNTCSHYTSLLEQQAYDKNGLPEKDGREDPLDAAGYFITTEYPILKPATGTHGVRLI